MASTKVEIRDNRELRRVEAVNGDGEIAGFADYQISVDGDSFDFTHTEVDERFAGEGIGTQLAAGVLDFVRGEDATIVPTCSFIRSYMEENEDTHDLLADGASLGDEDAKADQSDSEDGDEDEDRKIDQDRSEDASDEAGEDSDTDEDEAAQDQAADSDDDDDEDGSQS